LIPGHMWSHGDSGGHCLHGDTTVPLGCLTCGEGDLVPDLPMLPGPCLRETAPVDPLGWLKSLPVVAS
jgi:hypothetical protein